jgi:hypothetical protein
MMIMLMCMIATAVILQGWFDASDHRKAERIVRGYRGAVPEHTVGGALGIPPPATLGERVEAEAPGGAWSTEITHACRGFVRVTYQSPSSVYLFDYDVPEHRIHPANPAAERVLQQLPAK